MTAEVEGRLALADLSVGSGPVANDRFWRVSTFTRLVCQNVRQLVWIADDVDRADPSILEI